MNKIKEFDFELVGEQSASMGISEFIKEERLSDIMLRVDKALYLAKETGRKRIVQF